MKIKSIKKSVLMIALASTIGIGMVGCGKTQSELNAEKPKKIEKYTLSSIKNERIKTFLENLKTKGFNIGEVRKIDISRVQDQLTNNKKLEQEELDAKEQHAKESFYVQIDNEYVELYDCSNYTDQQDKDTIKECKEDEQQVGVIDTRTYEPDHPDKQKNLWYNMLYKDRILMMFGEHKDKEKLKAEFVSK